MKSLRRPRSLRKQRYSKRRVVKLITVATLLALVTVSTTILGESAVKCAYKSLTPLADFGDNPGALKGYYFIPENLPANAPLVVALHGCGQRACDYDDETGWRQLAAELGFALILPEQQKITIKPGDFAGNPGLCFSWWGFKQKRGFGEPLSIMNMVKRMVDDFKLDPGRIYVTGLSAGAGMTVRMLAQYPDCFAGGAPVAGVAYNCAGEVELSRVGHAIGKHCMCMTGVPEHEQCLRMEEPVPGRTADVWGDYVKDVTCGTFGLEGGKACPDTAQDGRWPRIAIWQGVHDEMVAPINLERLMLQWTNLHGIDSASGSCVTGAINDECVFGEDEFKVVRKAYADGTGAVKVQTNLILGTALDTASSKVEDWAGHATVVSSKEKCGCLSIDCACEKKTDDVCPVDLKTRYNRDGHVCQSRLIAEFWGLDEAATTGQRAPTCLHLQ